MFFSSDEFVSINTMKRGREGEENVQLVEILCRQSGQIRVIDNQLETQAE